MVRILHALAPELLTSTIKQIELLCEGLQHHGFENSICSFESNSVRRQRISTLGVSVSFCSRRSKVDPILVHRFGQELRQLRPDVIHFWGKKTDSDMLLSNFLYGRHPLVLSADEPGAGLWISGSSHFVASHEQAKLKLQSFGVPIEQIAVIRPGIRLSNKMSSIRSLQTELGLPSDVKFIAAMGDLLTEHRFRDAIWTLDLLRVIHPQVHLVIFGEGRDESHLRRVQRHVMSSDSVHFWGGEPEVQDLLRQCVCFWHTSPRDNSTILKAMAAGVPVVAVEGQTSETADRSSIVRDDETGYLVPFGDCAEIARKTNLLLNDAQRASRLQRAAHQSIRDLHSAEPMVQAFVHVYERAMNRSVAAA